jgi:hypothetical protein
MDEDSSQSTMKLSGTDFVPESSWYTQGMPEVGIIKLPEKSEWRVWLMGDYGKSPHGAIVYQPIKGQEPNWFHRKMQELCFGFQWRKGP